MAKPQKDKDEIPEVAKRIMERLGKTPPKPRKGGKTKQPKKGQTDDAE